MALDPYRPLIHQLPKIAARGTPILVEDVGTLIVVYHNNQWWIACRDALTYYTSPRNTNLPKYFRNYTYLRIRVTGHGRPRTLAYMRLSDALDGMRDTRKLLPRLHAICAAIANYMMPELASVSTPSTAPKPTPVTRSEPVTPVTPDNAPQILPNPLHIGAPSATPASAPEPAAAPQPIAKIKARIAGVRLEAYRLSPMLPPGEIKRLNEKLDGLEQLITA